MIRSFAGKWTQLSLGLCRIYCQQPPEVEGNRVQKLRALILGDTFVADTVVLLAENTLVGTAEFGDPPI